MKTILLLLIVAVGVLFPQGYPFAFLVRYVLMIMLLFAFVNLKIEKGILQKSHFYILTVNILFPILIYTLIKPLSQELASVAFITALAPTAIAAPVVTSLLKGRVDYVTFSLLLTNTTVALLLPFIIPLIYNNGQSMSVIPILLPVMITFLVPFLIAQLIKKFSPKLRKFLSDNRDKSFYFLLVGIYLGTSKATHYIQTEMDSSIEIVFLTALISFAICLVYFAIGRLLGGKNFRQEGGQSLGQKNNAFTIWVALTFINPLVALGPVFYIFAHNLVISAQLYYHDKKKIK